LITLYSLFTVLFRYVDRTCQNDSSNKITFINIFLYSLRIILKRKLRSICLLHIKWLLCVSSFIEILMCHFVSLTYSNQTPGHNRYKVYSRYVKPHVPLSLHFHDIACIYCVSLLTSSDPTCQLIHGCHLFMYTHACKVRSYGVLRHRDLCSLLYHSL
jgi:hypothetical protein